MIPIHSYSPANRRGYHCRLRSFIRVILSLGVPEFVVFAGCICKQAIVGTSLDHTSVMEHCNLVAELAT